MSARPPAVLVGIDTEADDQWSARGRQEMGVRNAARLPALQALFEEFGVRPTYVVTWEMATRPESASVLHALARTGRCEIGTHLHLKTFSRPLQSLDQLHHVRRMHIVIGGPVIKHQPSFELVGVSH